MSEQDDLEAYNAELAMQHDHETREKNELPNLWVSPAISSDESGDTHLANTLEPVGMERNLYIPAERIREICQKHESKDENWDIIAELETLIETKKKST